ncbi:hypothetical protein MOUN0_K05336 [Monosporozyma unispora]
MKLSTSATILGGLLAQQINAFPFGWKLGNLKQSIDELRTLQIGENEFITVLESEKLDLTRRGVTFMDITHVKSKWPFHTKDEEKIVVPEYLYPVNMTHEKEVNSLIEQIDMDSMHATLAKFTSFYTRYYKSQTGFDAAKWLSERISNIVAKLPKEMVSIKHVDHKLWDQFSIILSIRGYENPENTVVIGCHLDSINLLMPSVMPAPGADDNGSGTTTNLEALRLIAEHIENTGKSFKNTVEFHFYSAEEGGLLGSLDVFTQYAEEKKQVVAMLQQDMTGYVMDPKNEHIGVVTDYTTAPLNDFVERVVDYYLNIPYRETTCGYACSDHGSATRNGYPASFVIESEFKKTSKYIHSTLDTLDRLSIPHMAEHVKLVLGSVFELGDWESFK